MESQEEAAVARKPGTDRVQAVLALCGLAGPVLLVVVWAILAALRTDYSHLHGTLSGLGAVGAPNAVYANASIVAVGTLLAAFAVGLHRGIRGGRGSRVGPALVALGGLGLAGAGIFPIDFEDPQSFTSIMHLVPGSIGLFAFVAAPFFLFRRLRREDAWRDLASYSLATGVVAVVVAVVLLLMGGEPTPFVGAIQRLLLGVLLLWIVILAVRLLRLSLSTGPGPST